MPPSEPQFQEPSESNRSRTVDRRTVLTGLGGASLAGLAGCTSLTGGNAGGGGNTLTVGLSVPLSGDYSGLGSIYNTAFEAWMENVDGEIDGTPVEFVTEDNQSSESRASKIASRFASQDVDFVVNAYSSPLSRAMAPALEEAEIPIMTTGSLNYEIHQGFDYMFMFFSPLARKGTGEILAANDVSKVATLAVDLGWARLSQDRFIDTVAPDHDIDVVYEDVHARNANDFDSFMLKAKNAGAEAVISTNYPKDVVNMVRSMEAKNYEPKYLDCQSSTAASLANKLGDSVTGMCAPTLWMEKFETEGNAEFASTFKDIRKSEEISLDYHAALAYSALQSFEAAVSSGVTEGPDLREYFLNNTMETVGGSASFNENGVQNGIPWSLLQWRDTSEKKLIWPDDRATADLQFPKPW